ncbi:PREDICTED: U3 small nucleolar RNA-associated protein 6 homolog [Diuraphis noxia]|uniref:U3 small nucleolar RNA-associated protein 6 homolog n=1 Tax=Diuraphis noxia TaxID=143948 RepID=UPI000763B78B|nr:PREDICTED: U3 small nucleolar RNA-associated protein 6 homolog [Diuraphis noxia]
MAEFVQRRKEEMIVEVPVLNSHFKKSAVKNILNQREKFEYRLMRRNKQKSDFTLYIIFLKSIIKKVKKMGSTSTESFKLINQHNNRIIDLYRAALKYFKDDVSLWKEYIKFLMKCDKVALLRTVINSALLLHGHISDSLYVFAVKQEFEDLKNIQKAREMYTDGLNAHKTSSKLYFEAFKCELFMLTTFSKDPNYWDTLATNELLSKSNNTEKFKIMKCLDRYNTALTVLDTDEMWDKYLTTILEVTSDTQKTEIYKRNLLRQSMFNAHKKNKLKPKHYIKWINKSKSSMTNEILELANEIYPNDLSIIEINIKNKLNASDELKAYDLFIHNANKVSPSIWLTVVDYFLNKPQISEIFNMIFGDKAVCTNEVKQKLGNEYLLWLSQNKSLNDARNAYYKLITNSSCDASLCKTLVNLETEQQQIDFSKIRQHFTLACMQFGKTNIDLWMERIYFELQYGSPKLVSNTYHQALTTLNNEEADKFVEQYTSKASIFNKINKI